MLRRSLITPTAAEASVYTCDDLATIDDVAKIFVTADGTVPTPVAATQPAMTLTAYAVPVLGGLDCSWRVGTAAGHPLSYTADADWAYATVKVIPDDADSWAPYALGDGPSDTPLTIGDIETASGCGDPGCFISAPDGDSWVEIALSTVSVGHP